MKIKRLNKREEVPFSDLNAGDLFRPASDTRVCIKIRVILDKESNIWNAIDLGDNSVCALGFLGTDKVTRFYGELVEVEK